ncbi:hypothetical protein K504DRAFT_181237 [Pleomassaria siparia CBS 279.74]|uniref:Zn(2)-C6 fungal-type domain-containing protein n=1 Tax=Pleomassaria siparia CBS 279.74 TaxID=1314801 RepID=A0A6G1JRK3_9PLEO|nr:hypothetical protein K504DRAFT_181237 [Pleomassaria siparia CBS 279.74]
MSPSSRDRPMLSCARCYLMKKKCDKKVPICSRCIRAGAQCLGINRSDKKEVPRSALQYLQARLAEIESGLQHVHSKQNGAVWNATEYTNRIEEKPTENAYNYVLSIADMAFGTVCSPNLLSSNPGIHYDAKLFYGSERPPLKIPVKGIYNEEPPRMASRGATFRLPELPHMVARGIPLHVAQRLFDNYLKNILPRYPCFLQSDLVGQFNTFFLEIGQEVSESNCFVVSMVLAISSLTSKAHDFWKVASLSESLQRDALRHSSFLGLSSFRSLQCVLLLIQMALLLPYTSNLWYLSGEAMRMAISLGLHQELRGNPKLDISKSNLRRSVFWTVYQLERTTAIASGCPLAISDEHITTELPSDIDVHSKASLFISHVELNKIQSEIHGVQFFDQPLPEGVREYGDWIRNMEIRVQEWQEQLSSEGDIPG